MQLTDVQLLITDLVLEGRSSPKAFAQRASSDFNSIRSIFTAGTYDWLDVALGQGDYGLGLFAEYGAFPQIGDSVSFDYTVTFTTQAVAPSPVPIMSSGALLLSGLAAGAFGLRRKKPHQPDS